MDGACAAPSEESTYKLLTGLSRFFGVSPAYFFDDAETERGTLPPEVALALRNESTSHESERREPDQGQRSSNATLLMCAAEGAVILARAQRTVEPLTLVAEQLGGNQPN